MGANEKVAATFHGITKTQLLDAIRAVRSIPPLTDLENSNEMFLFGWEAAMEEVSARINESLGEQ